MDKNSTVTDIYFFTLSLTRQVVPKSILSTSEKATPKPTRIHLRIPNFKSSRGACPKTGAYSPPPPPVWVGFR